MSTDIDDSGITPTLDDLRDAYQSTDDGLDFKRRYWGRGREFDRAIETVRAEERSNAIEAVSKEIGRVNAMHDVNVAIRATLVEVLVAAQQRIREL